MATAGPGKRPGWVIPRPVTARPPTRNPPAPRAVLPIRDNSNSVKLGTRYVEDGPP